MNFFQTILKTILTFKEACEWNPKKLEFVAFVLQIILPNPTECHPGQISRNIAGIAGSVMSEVSSIMVITVC